LPPLEANRTDLYFFGQPGSGKSCILASLFYYLRRKGMIISNTLNNQGNIYRNQLTDELENGILPDSTARDGVNYIPIELRNQNNKNMRHPLNFIEMSGELFEDAYNEGISERNLAAQKYLDNNNRKLIYFVLDYDMHGKGINLGGVSQASKMEHILVLLDKFGILQKTEGIFIVLSKADLFPSGAQRSSFAKEFVNSRYKNFIENCKDLVEKYRHRNAFELKLYPYSIGTVRFQNLLTQFDEMSPQEMIDDIMNYTFISKKSFWGKLF
jgi:GTPase SAR1 family protein